MSAADTKAQLLAAIPNLTEASLQMVRKGWGRNNEMRQIINVLGEQKIQQCRTALESVSAEELPKTQGAIAGIRSFLAAINAEGEG